MANKMFNRPAYKIIGAILLIGASYVIYQFVPYFVADYQYEQLVGKGELSKQQVEDVLFLYSSRKISIEDSLWGKEAKLEDGDVCWQYLILWKEPIDVLYNTQEQVVRIFASYE